MDNKPIKILAINSSPKAEGETGKLLDLFIKAAEELGIEITKINLTKEHIHPFLGILGRKLKHKSKLQKEMIDADGFVIATPTYWFNEPGVLKDFIDSLTPLEENGFLLEGKVAGFIVYSPEGGETSVLENLVMTFNQMGVLFVPYSLIFYRGEEDKWAITDIKDLAKRLKGQIDAQRLAGLKWDKWKPAKRLD